MSTFDKVKEIIIDKLGVEEEKISFEAFVDDLGADSLDTVELIINLKRSLVLKFLMKMQRRSSVNSD